MATRRRRGRPPVAAPKEQTTVLLPKGATREIKALLRARGDGTSLSLWIRRLVVRALQRARAA